MLDIKFIRNNPELVQKATNEKNFHINIKDLIEVDKNIKPEQQKLEELQATRNNIAKQMATASQEQRAGIKSQVSELKEMISNQQDKLRHLKQSLNEMMLQVAQPARSDVPVGKDDQDNIEIERWGEVTKFDFKPKDHLELGKNLGIIDIERGVKIAGSRSYILKGDGALLEQAVLRWVYDYLISQKFSPVSVPVLVNESAMEGTGYFPIGKDQAYFIEKDALALVGTSEVSLCSMHSNETLYNKDLPKRLMAQSTCFRREAGTYGKDTRGLYRVHQFQKIEMVVVAPADKDLTDELHDEILLHAESILRAFELPYRKVYVCTGDLGQGQVRKHDLETWMPSRNSYGETHSCSSFYDFQARRLKIKYKDQEGKKQYAYTLNNTACATPRILIAILENNQTKDGKIKIPKCLQPYMNNKEFIG
ncbi:MAG: serine--tRNA ligase [Zetaproteobacteria bacterium]|nr:serine--tRNA ligase [Pseudobdellovibrionaceae bacterium]